MKKFLVALLLLVSVPSFAQYYHYGANRHYHHHRYYNGSNWVAPLIIGGVIGSAIANRPTTQNETVIIQPQPVIVQNQNCTPWTETQNSDGSITRTRTCQQ